MCNLFRRKKIIGRLERVDLPEFGIYGIEAKIDTGAYRSSIHASNIHEDAGVLRFTLLDEQHPHFNNHTYTAHHFVEVRVKSSNGTVEQRYKITTPVIIRGTEYSTDFTLSDRASMRRPVLIGRKVLRHRFIVDVSIH